jgi:hypothetical protein
MKNSVIILLLLCILQLGCGENAGEKSIATIRYAMDGCFGSTQFTLDIVSKGGESFAVLINERHEVSRVKLSGVKLQAFDKFMEELRMQKEGGFCTTQSKYEVEYRSEIINKGWRCDWDGFNRLRTAFFGKDTQ